MGIADKFLDPTYIPEDKHKDILSRYISLGVGECPVRFTDDPIEYCESKEFLDMRMRPLQKKFVEDLYSLNDKGQPQFSEGVFIAGMRSGKSVVAGVIATFQTQRLLAFTDPAAALNQLRGDKLTVQCIASALEQANETIYAKVEAIVNNAPWWQKYIEWLRKRETAPGGKGTGSLFGMFANSIEFFEKNVAIQALPANSGSLAGRTSACCIFDELSRFDVAEGSIQQKTQKRTAQAVYNTSARAATSLLPFSKVVTITSPMYEDDYGMQLLLKAGTFKGGNQSATIEALRSKEPIKARNLLGYHFTTFEVNPKYTESGDVIPGGLSEDDDFFVSKKLQDPEAYRRDYLALPPAAISPYIEYPERLLACLRKDESNAKVLFSDKIIEDEANLNGAIVTRRYVAKNLTVLSPDKFTKYYLCVDGGCKRDSFVIAMGHAEECTKKDMDHRGRERIQTYNKVIIDFVAQWVPDRQNRLTVSFQNAEDIVLQLCKAFNIATVAYDQWQSIQSIQNIFAQGTYTEHIGATLEMYEIFKQMIYTSLIEMPDDATLIKEIRQLNLIKNTAIDHPAGGCFTGDTRVKTLDGKNWTMAELAAQGADKEFWVYACTSTGQIVPAKAYNAHITKYVTELCEVTLDSGEVIRCTPDHLFMRKDGTYIPASSMEYGVSLMPCYTRLSKIKYRKGGYGKYTQIFTDGKWSYVHSWVANYFNFAIDPNKDEVIHHIDINSLNNCPDNLEKLSRTEHSARHIIIAKKAHTPEAIAKRVVAYKENYKNSPARQQRAREQYIAFLNTPEARRKSAEGTRAFFANPDNLKKRKEQLVQSEWYASGKAKQLAIDNLKKISKQTLQNNAHRVNNSYWQTDTGKLRRAELSKTQLREASKIYHKQTDEKRLTELASIIDINYLISSRHAFSLMGGSRKAWARRLGHIDFESNIKHLFGKPLEECCKLTRLTKVCFKKYLKAVGAWEAYTQYNHKVVSVKLVKLDIPIPVHDITVPEFHNFALDSGVIVHNSKDSSDAVCRVAYKLYQAYIKDAIQGNFMLPKNQRFPTIRSVATQYEMLNQQMFAGMQNNNGVFGGNFNGGYSSASSLFDGSIVRPNVVPNIDNK